MIATPLSSSVEQAFRADLAALLEVSAETLHNDDLLGDFANWDSLSIVSTLALADQHFSVTLRGKDLLKCQTVQDVLTLAAAKPSNGSDATC